MSHCGKHRSDTLNNDVPDACRVTLNEDKIIRNLMVFENTPNIFMSSQRKHFSLFRKDGIVLSKNNVGPKEK